MEDKQTEIVNRLTRAFAKASRDMGKAVKGTKAYGMQVDFMYLINEVTRGPTCDHMKAVAACNAYIDTVIGARNSMLSS